jgi:hypothetical protein
MFMLLIPSAGIGDVRRNEIDAIINGDLLTFLVVACQTQRDNGYNSLCPSAFLHLSAHLGLAAAFSHHAMIAPLTAVLLPVLKPTFAMTGVFRGTIYVDDHISLLK